MKKLLLYFLFSCFISLVSGCSEPLPNVCYVPEGADVILQVAGAGLADNPRIQEIWKLSEQDKNMPDLSSKMEKSGILPSDFENDYLFFYSSDRRIFGGVIQSRDGRAEKLFKYFLSSIDNKEIPDFRGEIVPLNGTQAIRLPLGGDSVYFVLVTPNQIQCIMAEGSGGPILLKPAKQNSFAMKLPVHTDFIRLSASGTAIRTSLPLENVPPCIQQIQNLSLRLYPSGERLMFQCRILFGSKEAVYEAKGLADLLLAAGSRPNTEAGTQRLLQGVQTQIDQDKTLIFNLNIGQQILQTIHETVSASRKMPGTSGASPATAPATGTKQPSGK